MYDLDNERKLNPEGRNGVTLYAPAILWRGIKNEDSGNLLDLNDEVLWEDQLFI